MKSFLLLILALLLCITAQSQEESPSPIIFIYDASGSMWGQIDTSTKMEIANSVLSETVLSLPESQAIGLVAYGHRQKADCDDVEQLVPVTNTNKDSIVNALDSIKPLGRTPLARSASMVLDEIQGSGVKATIILITDGIESCGGNICDVIIKAREMGVPFRLHIVGFGLEGEDTEQLKCAAKEGNGEYYDAADSEGLADVLQDATSATIDEPMGNFSVLATMNGENIDAVVNIVSPVTGQREAHLRTYRDTGYVYIKTGVYDVMVQPLENSDLLSQVITDVVCHPDSANHLTVSFDAARLNVYATNNGEGWDATVRVRSAIHGEQIAAGRTYGEVEGFDIDPGTYNIELLALNMKGTQLKHTWKYVDIASGDTLNLAHNYDSGVLKVGARKGDTLVDAIVSIIEIESNTTVDSKRTYTSASSNPKAFTINPGKYRVTVKGLADFAGQQESFEVTLGATETIERTVNFQ